MEGWLTKRGPTVHFGWQRRWCVLRPTVLEYFAGADCAEKKGSIELGPFMQAVPMKNPRAPGDSAKYSHEYPFGFVLDVVPSAGRSRKMYYFDAGDKETLAAWTDALTRAKGDMGKLRRGDVVITTKAFTTDQADNPMKVPVGQAGTILEIDEAGDAFIEFHDRPPGQWVFREKCAHFRKEVEPALKEVTLLFVPQSRVVMHWAMRVGYGLMARVYEFEADGVRIGRNSALHKGYPMSTQDLTGLTTRTHAEIEKWSLLFGKTTEYCAAGDNTLGGKNCQDFVFDLCEFLGIDQSQLPWRQAQMVKAAGVAVGVALGPEILAMGAAVGVAGMAADFFGISSCSSSTPVRKITDKE